MAERPTLRSITVEWLTEHGYDGLYQDDECACSVDDLMPCAEPGAGWCHPGYRGPCTCGEHDFHVYGTTAERDEAIETRKRWDEDEKEASDHG